MSVPFPHMAVKESFFSKTSKIIIFDLGAYLGQFCNIYRNAFPNATIYAFEPFKETIDRISIKDIIKVNKAVSNKNGEAILYTTKDTSLSNRGSLLPVCESAKEILPSLNEKIKVETITLDTFCEKEKIEKINILKMDIQGGELKALKGAEKMLSEERIDLIYTEVLFMELYKNQASFCNISNFLKDFNYSFLNFYGPMHLNPFQLSHCDAIFLSKHLREKL